MSGRLREIARQTVAIAEAGGYRDAAGRTVEIGAAVRAAVEEPGTTSRRTRWTRRVSVRRTP
ncbi:hypothetical protein ACFQY4_33270 [Catellatospora bangladeshensis]|uniref:hypothetical protein n=1 Tax=Catellatospora bangladeshensis TaxID=310355 RepID=UPI00360CDAF2